MPAEYVVRTVRGKEISGAMTFRNAINYAEDYMDNTGDKRVNIYTLSHTVEQKTERVPVEWEERTTFDVQKIKSGG